MATQSSPFSIAVGERVGNLDILGDRGRDHLVLTDGVTVIVGESVPFIGGSRVDVAPNVWERVDAPPPPRPPHERMGRLRDLSIKAYWAAENPTEATMAGILLDLFAPDVLP